MMQERTEEATSPSKEQRVDSSQERAEEKAGKVRALRDIG